MEGLIITKVHQPDPLDQCNLPLKNSKFCLLDVSILKMGLILTVTYLIFCLLVSFGNIRKLCCFGLINSSIVYYTN